MCVCVCVCKELRAGVGVRCDEGKEQLLPPTMGVSLSCLFHSHWSWAVHESEVSATPLTERSFSISGFLAQALVMGGRGVVNKGSEIVKLPCFTGPRDPGPNGRKMNTWEPDGKWRQDDGRWDFAALCLFRRSSSICSVPSPRSRLGRAAQMTGLSTGWGVEPWQPFGRKSERKPRPGQSNNKGCFTLLNQL